MTHFPAAPSSDVSVRVLKGWGTSRGLSMVQAFAPTTFQPSSQASQWGWRRLRYLHRPTQLVRTWASPLDFRAVTLPLCAMALIHGGNIGDILDHHNSYNVHNHPMTTLKRMYLSFGSYSFQVFSDVYLIRYQSIWKVAGYGMLIFIPQILYSYIT